jgi:hypothetical protein
LPTPRQRLVLIAPCYGQPAATPVSTTWRSATRSCSWGTIAFRR